MHRVGGFNLGKMYKNQLQELAQRSCFNLPSYACIREGPDHAPRFKATVNFNGEMFESPAFFSTLRLAEHAAAEVALNTLAKRGPSRTLAAKVLDETGVYKNLLQETAHRAGLNLPAYSTVRSGPGHVPVFSCTVELAGMSFVGELAKTKKQAQKNAAMSAWYALKQMSQAASSHSLTNLKCPEEQEQVIVARFLASVNPSNPCNLPQTNHQKGHPSPSSSSSKCLFPSTLTSPSSAHSYYQSWPYANFTPEMAMHPLWLQEQASEHHRRLMALGISIPALPPPIRVSPWMHPFYLSNQPVPDSFKTRPVMAISEIPAGKPGDVSKLSPLETLMDETVKDDVKEDGRPEDNQKIESEHLSSGPVQSPRPNLSQGASVRYTQRNIRPPLIAPTPPRMQSGINNSFSTRHLPGRMQAGGIHHAPLMAPAVQIRSVVPVSSAAPPRKIMGPSQEMPPPQHKTNTTTGFGRCSRHCEKKSPPFNPMLVRSRMTISKTGGLMANLLFLHHIN